MGTVQAHIGTKSHPVRYSHRDFMNWFNTLANILLKIGAGLGRFARVND